MDKGWIKLYRKLLDNEIFDDEKALRVFIYFLLQSDRKGRLKISRNRTSEILSYNPNTFKDIVDRLERHQLITKSATNRFTEIQVRNWAKYQAPTPTRLASGHHQNTTITRIENKEYKKKEINKEKRISISELKTFDEILKEKIGRNKC